MRKPLRSNLDVVTHTLWDVKSSNEAVRLRTLSKQPEYSHAKRNANYEAAFLIAHRLMSPVAMESIKTRIDYDSFKREPARLRPIVVAPIKLNGKSKNLIPMAMAHIVADHFQLEVCRDIVQEDGQGRTGKGALDRLIIQPVFSGKVEKGRKYIIVDDVFTMGGSIASLASYIEQGGGKVLCCSVLANQSQVIGTAKEKLRPVVMPLQAAPEVLNSMERKYGWKFGEQFERAVGFAIPALTTREASFVSSVFDNSRRFFQALEETRSRLYAQQGASLKVDSARPRGYE